VTASAVQAGHASPLGGIGLPQIGQGVPPDMLTSES
jgi:hypothetical protein